MQFKSITLAAFMAAATMNANADSNKQIRIVKHVSPQPGAKAPAEKDMAAYLFVYFKDETHSIHFATSTDGYTFTDINGADPILLGKDVLEQKGVRDPHIMRGPDGAFYMSMTDLHIFAQREGLRGTEWERPGGEYGWGNNRALILMKSFDLINWTHALVHVGGAFPAKYGDIGAAWAPQTIFDKDKNKLMVYFTTRHRTTPDYMVYSYVDSAYNKLETEPQRLFTYPKADKSTIDGDIIQVGDKYHLHYVAHDKPGGLRHAVSDKINEGFVFDPAKVDPETVACEAPMVWRRIGTDKYVLMYDVFGAKPNNMGFSETTDFKNYRNLGRFNEQGSPMKATNFSGPKHGTIMHITAEELERLRAYFGAKGQRAS
ncbi:glycoside hydrolase family 43 protein [Massilia niabensis]|uniref:Glycoside hydrolase family 43 protein n=1 Tax=Massilia niabensis TaxID=544910 RepID=A0ABW0L0P2_9BURK